MVALPTVGLSNNSWGTELNAFLGVSFNSDGTLKSLGAHTHLEPVQLASFSFDNPTGAISHGCGFSLTACTITAVRAIRTGGSGATVNFRLRGTDLVLASDLAVNAVYTVTTTLAFAALADTDRIEALLQSISGAPTSVEVFLIGTRSSL